MLSAVALPNVGRCHAIVSFSNNCVLLAAEEGILGEKPKGYTDEKIVEVPLVPPPKKALDKLF